MRDLARCRARARGHPWGGSSAFDRVRHGLTWRRLAGIAPRGRPRSVLELGFGRGALLAGFLRRGDRVTGVDPGMLERDVDPELRRGGTLHALRAEDVALSESAFDFIYGIHVVEHLDDPASVFRTCRGALRAGGLAYFITPNARSAGLRVFRDAWWNLEDPTHVRFFSPLSIATMLRAAGFQHVAVRRPLWDSVTLEISSLLRTLRRGPGEHGVLAGRAVIPLYAALLPFAAAARMAWPQLAPSMEVVAR
jgi:SAM-dependent methyltransferase